MLDTTLQHLRALVSFDTRNPPRVIDTGGIFAYLRDSLPGFEVSITDHGAGAVSLYAVRGKPSVLFNVHMDTVPDSPHWSASPFELRVEHDRAIGLGACDIKGAAAALLAAASIWQVPLIFGVLPRIDFGKVEPSIRLSPRNVGLPSFSTSGSNAASSS